MVTLSIKTDLTEDRYNKEIKDSLEKAFNNIQIEFRSSVEKADIYLIGHYQLEQLFEKGELLDFRLLSNSLEATLERLEPNLVAWGKDENGEVFSLPYNNANEYPLFYNKSIFDKLNLPYPSDNMTWEDSIALAERVTANKGGEIIYGFDPADLALMRMQLAVHYIDPKTGKPNLLHPNWMKIARTLKEIYSLEGNILSNRKKLFRLNGYFVRDQSVAMGMICASCFEPQDLNFEWDIVSYPIYVGGPAWNANIAGLGLAISQNCSDPHAAFEVISYLLENEHQTSIARNGFRPSLTDPRIHAEFGMNNPLYYGKNIASFSMHAPAPPLKNKLELDWDGHQIVREGLIEMISNDIDEESALYTINQKLGEFPISRT